MPLPNHLGGAAHEDCLLAAEVVPGWHIGHVDRGGPGQSSTRRVRTHCALDEYTAAGSLHGSCHKGVLVKEHTHQKRAVSLSFWHSFSAISWEKPYSVPYITSTGALFGSGTSTPGTAAAGGRTGPAWAGVPLGSWRKKLAKSVLAVLLATGCVLRNASKLVACVCAAAAGTGARRKESKSVAGAATGRLRNKYSAAGTHAAPVHRYQPPGGAHSVFCRPGIVPVRTRIARNNELM